MSGLANPRYDSTGQKLFCRFLFSCASLFFFTSFVVLCTLLI
nr:MAG TPA: hypothetical protein [Caudoviricetes sp.]